MSLRPGRVWPILGGAGSTHRPLGVLSLASPAQPSGTPAQVLRVEWAPDAEFWGHRLPSLPEVGVSAPGVAAAGAGGPRGCGHHPDWCSLVVWGNDTNVPPFSSCRSPGLQKAKCGQGSLCSRVCPLSSHSPLKAACDRPTLSSPTWSSRVTPPWWAAPALTLPHCSLSFPQKPLEDACEHPSQVLSFLPGCHRPRG